MYWVIIAGTRAPIRRTVREPKRTGNPFIVTREVPVQPQTVPQPERVKEDERKKVPA